MHAKGLRAERMTWYAPIVAREVEDWIAGWGDEGEMDFYEAFADLTIKTSTHCLLGSEFRYSLTDEFARHYHDLGEAADAAGTVDHAQQKAVYDRRDRARKALGELIIERITAAPQRAARRPAAVYMNSPTTATRTTRLPAWWCGSCSPATTSANTAA
jgi:sterol 14-demethylase